jgi:hypothetical protein
MSVRILATRGTESQIQSASSASQSEGQIAYATDTKDFYVSDGTQFNKIGKDQLSQFSEISVVTDIGTWTVNQDNALDLNPPEGNPTGITFKPDGTKVFTIGYSLNRVQMYDLSTAWDLTSAGSPTQSEYLVQNNLSSTQEDFFIDSSGTRMYVLSRSSDSIGQFTLNTAWDISDITFVQDVHLNSTGLSGGVAGFVTGEPDPSGLTFKPDGTILYIVGYNQDKVHQIPLSTAWDISTHGTITSVDVSLEGTPNAVQFNNDGTEMYVMGYSTDSIHYYSLSTAWDVTTASFVKASPSFRNIEGTGTGFYYNETEQKSFICGRSTDFAYEVNVSEALRFTDIISAPTIQGDTVVANELITPSTGQSNFYNSVYTHGFLQTNSSTYLGYNTGAQNIRIGNTAYGNFRFHVFQGNYIESSFINDPTTNLPNIRFFNPLIGGVGVFSIGKTHNTSSNYLLGGVTDIESEADTFDHKGEITLGGELKIAGNQPLRYKDPNLYTQGTQIVLDNFTEASDTDLLNHTPDTGSGYTRVYVSSGANNTNDYAKISGGDGYVAPARNNTSDGFRFTNDTTISTANYEARAVIKRQSTSDDPLVLFVKYIDEDNYFAMHFAGNYSYCTPMSVVNGVHTQHGYLYYHANTSSADNINIEVALRVVGNNVHLFYEGRYRGSREVNITGIGKAGIGFGKSNNSILTSYDLTTNAQISKFEIYELPDSLFDGSNSVHYIENGGLGIGTTSIGTAKVVIDHTNTKMLELKRNGTTKARFIADSNNGQLDLYDSSTVNSVRLLSSGVSYLNGGNVGIGTTSPAHKLDVSGDVHLNNLQLSDFAGDIYFGVNSANNKFSYNQWLASASGGMVIKNTANASTGHIAFETSTGEALRIIRGGQLLLNATTTSFSDKLYINGDAYVNGAWRVGTSGTYVGKLYNTSGILTLESDSTRDIQFGSVTNGTAMFIEGTNGRVGIGTTSPTSLLHLESAEDAVIRLKSTDNKAFITLQDDDTNAYISAENSKLSLGANPGVNANNLNFDISNNNVGIGTSAPTSTLHVAGTARIHSAANGAFGTLTLGSINDIVGDVSYIDFKNNGSSWMRINNGNVGIGTTSPTSKLHVEGTSKFVGQGTWPMRMENNVSSGDAEMALWTVTDVYAQNENLSLVATSNNLNRPVWYFQGSGDGWRDITLQRYGARVGIRTLNPSANLTVQGDGTTTGKTFLAQDSNGSALFTILDSGNVGIGTTSPYATLTVAGNITQTENSHLISTRKIAARNASGLALYNDGGQGIDIKDNNDVIVTSGNVGIGTTSPARPLHVDGSSGARISYESANMDLFYYGIEFNRQSNYLRPTTNSGKSLYIGSGSQNYTWGNVFIDSGIVEFRNSSSEPLMRFDSSTGRLGIGTTSPDHLLHVAGNAKMSNIYLLGNIIHEGDVDTQIKFATDTIKFDTAGSERLTIASDGNVGIGTTSPGRKLTIAGTDNLLFLDSSGNSYLTIDRNATNRRSALVFSTAGNGTSDIPNNINWALGSADSDEVGDGTGFFINTNSSATSAKLFIASTGNVGIGTTAPSVKLEIGTDGGGENKLRINSDVATNYLQFESLGNFSRIRTTNGQNLFLESAGAGGYITFNANGAERMRVLYDGKVGIGTTSPVAKLDVEGLVIARNNGFQLRGTSPSATTYTSIEQNGTEGVFRLYNGSNWGFIARGVANNPYIGAYQNGSLRIRGFGAIDGSDNAADKDLAIFDFTNERVGIGTLNPTEKLHVVGKGVFESIDIFKVDTTANPRLRVGRYDAETLNFDVDDMVSRIYHKQDETDSSVHKLNLTVDSDSTGGSEINLGFRDNDGSNESTKLTILSSGKVGIGTTNPSQPLHVNGNGRFGGDVYINGQILRSDSTGTKIGFDNNIIRLHTNTSERMRIDSSGNVGIGTTSPTTALQVVGRTKTSELHASNGNAIYTNQGKVAIGTSSVDASAVLNVVGDVKASGTIKGKMEQMFACSFSDDLGTTKHYIPFTSNAEQTNVHADQVAMVMPYGGRVKCIQMRLSTIDADTTRTLGIESIAPGVNMFENAGNWVVEETEAYELVASDNYYLVNYVFSNETHFDSGDLLAISIQDSEDAYAGSKQAYVNVIIEYDLNNGMGNDTATTKYTS